MRKKYSYFSVFVIGLLIAGSLQAASKKEEKEKDSKSGASFEIGGNFGYSPNLKEGLLAGDLPSTYQGGEAAQLMPTMFYGIRFKMNFLERGILGLRAGALMYSIPEQSDTSNPNADDAYAATTWKGSGLLAPVQLTVNPINTRYASMFVGYGVAYHSLELDATISEDVAGTELTYNLKSTGLDHAFVVGAGANLTENLSLTIELFVTRGGNNKAEYTLTDSEDDKNATTHNAEFVLLGLNFLF